jgi:hypothetical protein
VWRGRGVVVRRDPEPAVRVDARWVGSDLGEAAERAVVRQDGLDEEGVGVAHHLQVTPATGSAACRHQRSVPTANAAAAVKNVGRHGGAYPSAAALLIAETTCVSSGALLRQSRMSSGVFPLACSSAIILSWKRETETDLAHVFGLPHWWEVTGRGEHSSRAHYHERVPAHGWEQALEGVGGAELGDDPFVAVPVDDGPVEVEYHHDGGGGRGRHTRRMASRKTTGRTPGLSAALLACRERRVGPGRLPVPAASPVSSPLLYIEPNLLGNVAAGLLTWRLLFVKILFIFNRQRIRCKPKKRANQVNYEHYEQVPSNLDPVAAVTSGSKFTKRHLHLKISFD